MNAPSVLVAVRLQDPEDRPERLEASVEDVILDIERLGGDVAAAPGRAAPPGSRAGEVITIGALLITLARTPGLLKAALSVLETWLQERNEGTVEIEIDGDTLSLTGAHRSEQRRVIESFVERHMRASSDDQTTP